MAVRDAQRAILSAIDELRSSLETIDGEEHNWAWDALDLACRIGEMHGGARWQIWTRDWLRRGQQSVTGEDRARQRLQVVHQAQKDKLLAFAAAHPEVTNARQLARVYLPAPKSRNEKAVGNMRKRFARALGTVKKDSP